MACGCADDIDAKLAPRNTRLTRAIVFSAERCDNPNLMLRTEQIETGRGKAKAVAMFLTYCPFCGARYEPTEPPAAPHTRPAQGKMPEEVRDASDDPIGYGWDEV